MLDLLPNQCDGLCRITPRSQTWCDVHEVFVELCGKGHSLNLRLNATSAAGPMKSPTTASMKVVVMSPRLTTKDVL